ncbi:2Fe-2S iron-sulfur cluster-binding protein [Shimia ponticola]|uniref:2Fe-2S iron-sulfur cluster-binding protein n=1 Tax=Shimia ponticola TaxID=2582893 RepID=UPI0011BDB8AF|nr:2Fe-2S iron-sulfur cluster-binding protein [Shimia ponticola]
MAARFFSDRHRPVHMGPFPLERLARIETAQPDTSPPFHPLEFTSTEQNSVIHAMAEYQAMMDTIRDGLVNKVQSEIPEDPQERANHLKAFGYFSDAAQVGIGPLPKTALLQTPVRNPAIDRLREDLKTRQTKTLASGIDLIMADLKDAMSAPPTTIVDHHTTIVFLYDMPRDPHPNECGTEWIKGAQAHRACLRATETAVVIANYIRLLGFDAKAHTATSTDVDLNQCTLSAGLATIEHGQLTNPYLGTRFGVAVVTTSLDLTHDRPLAPLADQPRWKTHGPAWWLGAASAKSARTLDPYTTRSFRDGAHPFETLKRVDAPTTYMDEEAIPRVPKRTDMFARAQFGDMGKANQKNATGGYYARKAAPSMAQRRMLGAFTLLQDGEPAPAQHKLDPQDAADLIKATSYYLGVDAVGLSRCPDWAWYSHDATGTAINPPHDNAISMIIDQGYETMEGASGDDWISVAQSMRAYLRFSLLGGVIANQIRRLGYSAKAHTVIDGDVLQPPLLLLSGLGEVSRIGEVILNPFLGPRLKSGVVTTDLPLAHDKPIDFGLQNFCESCNKCARECPSGAITAGPKLMFNGYEIWKSDSQKCTTYRIGTLGGAMCGRCMKTCPWNLEGLFAERPFRWAAMNLPKAAPALAKLDDLAGNGGLNPVKKWWWDLELSEDGGYRPTRHPVNARGLQTDLDLKYEDQTLAVYPAPLAPHPYPYPFPMDREAGIKAYQDLITADDYQSRKAAGEQPAHTYTNDTDSPVLELYVAKAEVMSDTVTKFEFRAPDGSDLPAWTAGAHLDIVVAPEYLRQYSMSGDPADRSCYQIGVLREDGGRGGSKLLHRIFSEGRRVFVSRPINHFPLVEDASHSVLIGGGIGITPLIAMAHRLHALGSSFELHYCMKSRVSAGYLTDLAEVAWADKVTLHVSDEGSRADLSAVLKPYADGRHLYTCGPDAFMNAVSDAAHSAGYPEDACRSEYFAVPEAPDWVNLEFTLKIDDGRQFTVPVDKTATDTLAENGIHVDVKCSDGICGVCRCELKSGDVEHRDYVLSQAQREHSIILCQSRAAKPGGTIEIALPD